MKVVPFRRKREKKTNYKKRLRLLKSKTPRLVIRATKNNICAQVTLFDYTGDKIVCSVTGKALDKAGYTFNKGNTCAGYLIGLMIGKMAQEKKIKETVVDFGLQTVIKKSRLFAVVKGAIEAGLQINCDEACFPDEARITGKHIVDYASKAKDKFTKKGVKPEDITKTVESIKKKIIGN
jgi:large subunit ribosomal protein L18